MTRYYVQTKYGQQMVLRRRDVDQRVIDEEFFGGAWRPTQEIIDFRAGNNDFLDPVSEHEARRVAPDAF